MATRTNQNKITCSSCGEEVNRKHLTSKRIEFATYGKGSKRLRTRTVGRLCPDCRNADPAWNQQAYVETPEFKDNE